MFDLTNLPEIKSAVLFTLGAIGLVWYVYCLVAIGCWPVPADADKNQFRNFQSFSLTTIAASLATFVGMLVGVQNVSNAIRSQVTEPSKAVSDKAKELAEKAKEMTPVVPRGNGGAEPPAAQIVKTVQQTADEVQGNAGRLAARTQASWMQWLAAGVYVASLVFALVCWRRLGDKADPAVSNLGKSLLGLMAGALTGLLAVNTPG